MDLLFKLGLSRAKHLLRQEFVVSLAVAALVLLTLMPRAHASTQPTGGQQPADVYCNDLQTGIDEAYKKAMQSRMPSQTPGRHMDENYDVHKTIEKEVNYGLGSINDVLNQLFSYMASKANDYKERVILGEINKTMQAAIQNSKSVVSMPSSGSTPQSLPGNVSYTPSPANPAVGQSATAQSTGSIAGKVSDFFSNLFK